MSKKVVVASGYFNPLHYGHVSFLQKAKDLGGTLVVIVNNDRQAALRLGGQEGFESHGMPVRDRVKTVRCLACVDAALEAMDNDETVCKTLRLLHPDVFANGGAQSADPREAAVCTELGIQMVEGLGVEVLFLKPYTQHYDWGKPKTQSLVATLSQTALSPELSPATRKSLETKPFAELWMGDHPSGPSSVRAAGDMARSSGSLADMMKRSPSIMGSKLAEGAKLPFLLKVLSINKALSIQAHPDRILAERLHRERPDVYKDANHKPEISIALGDFEAMCGFRELNQILEFVRLVPEFLTMIGDSAADALSNVSSCGSSAPAAEAAALKAAYSHMMHTADDIVVEQVRSLVARAEAPPPEGGTSHLSICFELVRRLSAQYPDDIGIFSVFFFNYVKLKAGECLYMAQNVPHFYLSGDIVECMATSDNVVRGGLTPKFKDVEVLCEMLRYVGGPPQSISPQELAPGVNLYADSDINEFQVTHVKVPAGTQRRTCFSPWGPTVAFACSGTGRVCISGDTVALSPGVVFFLAAGVDADLKAEEDLEVFAACCPPQYFNPPSRRKASPSPDV